MGSSDRTALGDRMKRYEAVYKPLLPKRAYTIMRVDGRHFHTLTKGLHRPYDEAFGRVMNEVALALCQEITGSQFAYVQSDEVSVLYTDFAKVNSEPWFGGELVKQVSIGAAVASNAFNNAIAWIGKDDQLAQFDARVFTIPDPVEVANYFYWRQQDCMRNSVSMAASAMFSAKQLHGLSTAERKEKMFVEKEEDWDGFYRGFTHGRVVYRAIWGWMITEAPTFKATSRSWLSDHIPPHTMSFWEED